MKKQKSILTGDLNESAREVFRQYLIDHNRLCEAAKDGDFVKILKEIIPYWKQKEIRHELEAGYMLLSIQNLTLIHRGTSRRELPPSPSSFREAQDWAITVEKLLKKKLPKYEYHFLRLVSLLLLAFGKAEPHLHQIPYLQRQLLLLLHHDHDHLVPFWQP